MKKKLLQYIIGLWIMGLGIVLIKKASLGMSPISTIPNALTNITRFSLGNLTIAFQIVCILMIILITRKITWKTIIILPAAIAFGYIIDLYMYLLKFGDLPIIIRCIMCLLGIMSTAFGIVTIKGADFVLPAPDELMCTLSDKLNRKLSLIKTCGDILWVVISLIIELSVFRHIYSVGIGTIASMLLTGWFVGRFALWFPTLKR